VTEEDVEVERRDQNARSGLANPSIHRKKIRGKKGKGKGGEEGNVGKSSCCSKRAIDQLTRGRTKEETKRGKKKAKKRKCFLSSTLGKKRKKERK